MKKVIRCFVVQVFLLFLMPSSVLNAQEYAPDWGFDFGLSINPSNGDLINSASDGWNNNGAISTNLITQDGFGHFSFVYQGGEIAIGLSPYDYSDFSSSSIRHGVYITNGDMDVIIQDQHVASFQINFQDTVKIEKSDEGVAVYLNEDYLHSETVWTESRLHIKAAISTASSSITNIKASFSSFQSKKEMIYWMSSNDDFIHFNKMRSKFYQSPSSHPEKNLIYSRNSTFEQGKYIGFYLPDDFEGAVGVDGSTSNNEADNMSLSLRVESGEAFLYNGASQELSLGAHSQSVYYEFLNVNGFGILQVDGIQLATIDLGGTIDGNIKIISENGSNTLHFGGFQTNMEWERNPLSGLVEEVISSDSFGKIIFNKSNKEQMYYSWGGEQLRADTTHFKHNQFAKLNYRGLIQDDPSFVLDTLSYIEYLISKKIDTNALSFTSVPFKLNVTDSIGGNSVFEFQTSYEIVLDKTDSTFLFQNGNVFTTDVSDTWGDQNTVYPMNTLDTSAINSGLSFQITDLNSEATIGILDDSWRYSSSLPLPTHGYYFRNERLYLIYNGSIQESVSINPGDEFGLSVSSEGLSFIRNSEEFFSIRLAQRRFASIIALNKGGFGNLKYYSPPWPEVAIENGLNYCDLASSPSFETSLFNYPKYLDLHFVNQNKYPISYFQWFDKSGNVVSNSKSLKVNLPGLYTLTYFIQTSKTSVIKKSRSYIIGYNVEWESRNNTITQPNHSSIQPTTSSGFTPPYIGTWSTGTNATSQNYKSLTSDDFVYFNYDPPSVYGNLNYGDQFFDAVKFQGSNDPFKTILVVTGSFFSQSSSIGLNIGVISPSFSSNTNLSTYSNNYINLKPSKNDIIKYYDSATGKVSVYLNGIFLLDHQTNWGGAFNNEDLELRYDFRSGFLVPSNNIMSTGLKDVIYSRSCKGTLIYYDLFRKPNTNTVLATGDVLGIRYYEDYSVAQNAELNFKIYDDWGDEVSLLPNVTYNVQFGENRIILRLDDLGLTDDNHYLLEVENDKESKRYLRFKY